MELRGSMRSDTAQFGRKLRNISDPNDVTREERDESVEVSFLDVNARIKRVRHALCFQTENFDTQIREISGNEW